ncbi:MAG: hypothetical protein IJ983_04465 [Kiritimatiellae bacterium]|nr:hypothetical protein [Kiritimatiellia bacterium]
MSKLRTDSWASALTEEQGWQLYYKSRALRWNEAADWAVKEFGVDAPSRTAFYSWLGRMRAEESAHRLEQAATAAAEAAALAKTQTSDEAQIAAYKAMATELALRTGSADEAAKFVNMAAALSERRLRAQELKLKARAQQTKDETLRLAREKFEAAERRLAAVQDAVKSAKTSGGGLTPETLRKIEEAAGLL